MSMIIGKSFIESSTRLSDDIGRNYNSARANATYEMLVNRLKYESKTVDAHKPQPVIEGVVSHALLILIDNFDISKNKTKITQLTNEIAKYKRNVYLIDNPCLAKELLLADWAIISPKIPYIDNDYVSRTIKKSFKEIYQDCSTYHFHIIDEAYQKELESFDFDQISADARVIHARRSIEDYRVLQANVVSLAKRTDPLFGKRGGSKTSSQMMYRELVIRTSISNYYELNEDKKSYIKIWQRGDHSRRYIKGDEEVEEFYKRTVKAINEKILEKHSIPDFIQLGNKGWIINVGYRKYLDLLKAPLQGGYIA